jgi:hypothetical protein
MLTLSTLAVGDVVGGTDGHHGTVRISSASCGGYNSTSTPVVLRSYQSHRWLSKHCRSLVAADQQPDLLAHSLSSSSSLLSMVTMTLSTLVVVLTDGHIGTVRSIANGHVDSLGFVLVVYCRGPVT